MLFCTRNITSYSNEAETKLIPYFEDFKFNNLNLEVEILSKVNFLISSKDFKGKNGEIQSINLFRNEFPKNIILVGLGKKEEFNLDKLRKCIGKAVKEAAKFKSISIDINPEIFFSQTSLTETLTVMAEAVIMADYKFDKYKEDKKASFLQKFIILFHEDNNLQIMDKAINEGFTLGQANILARTLVNEPSNLLGTIELSEEAKKAGKESCFEVEVFNEEQIIKLNMKAFLEVAKASANPPQLIVMRYNGDPKNKDEILGLVGKGLTYDCGGLSIKPTASMFTMKSDMGGAAAVIGAMTAISKLKVNVNVVAVIAACENMISGNSYRPGDIIGSMGGKTIEIINTDAEGRLTLVDAVNYIIEKENATKVVDIATLTGAVLHCLGTSATGVVTNDDLFYNKLEIASKISGEKVWKLPAFEEYKELIKSEVADLKNSSGAKAGTITAGLFIGEFVQEKPWLHLDIAGTSWSEKDCDCESKGGTGAGARLLYHLAKQLEK